MNRQMEPDLISSLAAGDFQTAWKVPSNIALIKYWGKRGNQLPNNPSLSITLKNAVTITRFHAKKREYNELNKGGVSLKYFFNDRQNKAFEERISRQMTELPAELPFLAEYTIRAESSNTFPYSAGIASSASSMAAVSLFITELEQIHTKSIYTENEFYRRASGLARQFSGSASRSLFGGWTAWGASEAIPESSDYHAVPLLTPLHPVFENPGVAILLISSTPKKVSSTRGHQLMDSHPFAKARYKQARNNLMNLLEALASGNFDQFAQIAENEALTLHSLLMTSSPEGLLLKPESLHVMEAVRDFRKATGTPVCFTLDAGPNILLIYPQEAKKEVATFINKSLFRFCENGKWIDDCMGKGPEKLRY
ncbi:MAG: diphosphomevalonate decarboxylase [Mariniphaga sp.]